jgi:DeoR/GlpR family transcriptional regulator of sugar metabolism
MRDAERRTQLIDRLRARGHASVAELARGMGVTSSTIRRDLRRLERDGRLLRTYGGAALRDRPTSTAELDPELEAKRRIAAAAASLVRDGDTIGISSGTTALEFARLLTERRLTVVTNALDVAGVLLDRPGIELIVLGGVVRPGMHSMLGHLAELATRELRADTLYMGIGAISLDHGLMNDSVPEILTDRALRRMARTCTVLADASKFEHVATGYVFGLEEVDTVVTDGSVSVDIVRGLTGMGIRTLIAGESSVEVHDPAPAQAGAT